MHKRIAVTCVSACLSIFGLLAFTAAPAMAQAAAAEKPRVYTYVAEWAIPRAMWVDYEKQEAGTNDAMKKLVADGTLLSFGSFAVLNHQEGAPTHGSWFSASSMANLMKVLEGLRAANASTSQIFAASKHWDYILSSRNHNTHSGTFTNGYLRVATWVGKAGGSDPDGKILKASMVAMMEKMFADGSLHAYSIDEENVHTMNPNAFFVVMLTNGPEGLDKFDSAIEDMNKNNPTALAAFRSLVGETGHIDSLARVDIASYK